VPERLRLPTVLITALAVAEAAVLLLRPRERFPFAKVEARAYFSADELVKAKRFRTGQMWLYGGRTALDLTVLAAAARRAPRAGAAPVRTAALTAAALTAGGTAVSLPLRAASRQRAKNVGLVTQSWGGWAVDVAKGAAIGGVLSGAGGAALAVGMRRFGRAWWAPGAAAVAGFAVLGTYLSPVLLDPVFNTFKVLPEGTARADVLELARAAGVDVGEVYEVDASRRTTAANAYVTGIGRTKRVVLYDTIMRDFTPAELRLVVAHELGHVRHRDVAHGLLWLALVAPFGTLAVARVGERLQRPDTTPVPAMAITLSLLAPAVAAISNQLSRAIERRADRFALDLTQEPEALIAFERRITIQNVGDPEPPRWEQLLLGTHPPTMERIGAALAYSRP
jgi:STE24 endopeptidase